MSVLSSLLASPPGARRSESLDAFLAALLPIDAPPFDAAVLGGALADRASYAFVAGIRAALSALVPHLSKDAVIALAATEARGAHPRTIETRLDETTGVLHGEKLWATLAPRADLLLVLAKAGEAGGRNVLRLVCVNARSPGVRIVPMPETPFAPEVPHATVMLDGAQADAVLDGDGYEAYVKPFRTLEDLHVLAALVAYLVVEARARCWPRVFVEDALAALSALRGLANTPPMDAATHVALGGVLRVARSVLVEADALFAENPEDEGAKRWVRDRPLRDVAERARAARLVAAWQKIAPE